MWFHTASMVWAGSVVVCSEVKAACSDRRDVDDDEAVVLPQRGFRIDVWGISCACRSAGCDGFFLSFR